MNDQDELIELYRLENKAMVEKDLLTLNKILANDMTLTHMTGYVQSKMKWIDEIQNDQMQYFSSKEENIEDIEMKNEKASLVGQNQVKARIWDGSVNTWPLQMKMYFKKVNGTWLIARQDASTY